MAASSSQDGGGNVKDLVFEAMKGRSYLKVVGTKPKPASPLDYIDKLTYSVLRGLQRRHKGRHLGISGARIARRAGLDRTAVARSLIRLDGYKLAAKKRQGWIAQAPQGEAVGWFAWTPNKIDDAWYNRMASHRVYLPSEGRPLSTKENGLLWLLHSLANVDGKAFNRGRGQTKRALGNLVPLSRPTIDGALKTLKEMKLVGTSNRGFVVLVPPDPSLWKSGKKAASAAGPASTASATSKAKPEPRPEHQPRRAPDPRQVEEDRPDVRGEIHPEFDAMFVMPDADLGVRDRNEAVLAAWRREAKAIEAGPRPPTGIRGDEVSMPYLQVYMRDYWPIMLQAGIDAQGFAEFWQGMAIRLADPLEPNNRFRLLEFCLRFPELLERAMTKYPRSLNDKLLLKIADDVWLDKK